jgi:hypothetical protein
MGRSSQGGYIRIQNNSSIEVEIKLVEGRNVDDMGLDQIVGTLSPGEQLPTNGTERSGGGIYQYIEGDVRNRFQKDGYFHLQAHPTDNSPCSKLSLVVDRNSWEAKDTSPDKDSIVKFVADVDESDEDDNFKIELRVYDNYNASKWMEEYGEKHGLGGKPFCRIGLPGTHDSGTYRFDKEKGASPESGLTQIEDILDRGKLLGKLNDWILTQVFERLCQCQALTIRQQLDEGIRYLDLRLAYHAESETIMTCHGVYCVDIKEILQEIAAFLDENTKEIVILEFKKLHEFGPDQHAMLKDLIFEILGDKVAVRDDCPATATVQEYWDKGYQAVVLYQDRPTADESEGKLWPLFCIDSPWPNAGDTTELYNSLKDEIEKHNPKHFFVAQAILTPDVDLIKKELMDGGGLSIRKISKQCGGKVVDWVEEEWKPAQKLNIVIVDFFNDCNLLPAVINYNRA